MLIDGRAVLNIGDPKMAGFYDVFEFGSREAIKLLLQTNINLSAGDHIGETPLHALASNKNPGVIKELSGKSFTVDVRNHLCGTTPLMRAALHGNADTVEFLLNAGADVNAVNDCNSSALIFAILCKTPEHEQQYKQCVQIFLEYGANVQLELNYLNCSTIFDVVLMKKHFELGNLVLSHLALQEARGIWITEPIRANIISNDQFKIHFDSSQQCLLVEVYRSITLYDLLTVTDRKFELNAQNDQYVSKINDTIVALSEFYYFQTILQRRLLNAISMIALKKEAGDVICNIMSTSYERFPHIADNIISYLEHEDMNNLIEASP